VAKVILNRPIELAPNSDAVFLLARSWINDCLSNHDACPKAKDELLPTRLIDVSLLGDPRIYLSSPDEKGQYLALSYCWGTGPKDYVLTSNTMADKCERIPLRSLPQTIRDAIAITRHFSYRFIWIDALCILQDSTSDWESEAAVMGRIYANATFTIAAASASAATEGIFTDRRIDTLSPPRLSFFCQDGTKGTALIRYKSPSHADTIQPLHFRAWTLQERLLSPRVLLYGSHHLTWECAHHSLAEGETPYDSSSLVSGAPASVTVSSSGHLSDEEKDDLCTRWYTIVREYSKRNMTVASDKLPALAGIAAKFHELLLGQDQYIAGIWRGHLPEGLVWTVSGTSKPIRSRQYRAPSWSWASIDGEVFFEPRPGIQESYAVVKSVQLDTSTVNKFGAVKSCTLHLQAPILKVRAVKRSSMNLFNRQFSTLHRLYLPGSTGLSEGDKAGSCNFDDYDEMLAIQDVSLELFCLQVTADMGILICPAKNGDFYRRVGSYGLQQYQVYDDNGNLVRGWHESEWFRGSKVEDIVLV